MPKRLSYALAGLRTGITGALGMLAFLGMGSLWARHSLWWIPNLIAASVYGQSSVRDAAAFHTLSGIALALVFYGLAGAVFGEIAGERHGNFRFFCISLLAGMLLYWLLLNWFWRGLNPVGHLYAPDGQLLFAHLFFGCFLANYPRVLRRLSE